VDALGRIHEWTGSFLSDHGFGEDAAFMIDLFVEELFTNMVKYNRDGKEDIEIGLAARGAEITLTVRDFGVASFDPTTAPEVDPDMPDSERRRGGLGIHLVRQMADRFQYDYRDRNSTITVIKRLES
jgi:serine/threonine-protein kinase RsbW/sigma-B regulation protein RsbU (phosphoserine phosphatase)